jgi:glyoxylase-like metal-dependent hydrolase (beta-lactamase superfamily II)
MPLIRDDILQVRAPALCFYVLRAPDGLYLLDAGFIGGLFFLRRALRRVGWERDPIRGVIVTHGHLDHVLNIARVVRMTSAWVAAPRLDAEHFRGAFRYSGAARVTGGLEAVGRRVLRYRTFDVDRRLDDGSELDIWHGLTAVHLPGHTAGHMGFYCRKLRLLFSGDLFASYKRIPDLPPNIFNSFPAQAPASVEKALALDLDGILPNHADTSPPAEHLERLRRLRNRYSTQPHGDGGGPGQYSVKAS